MRSFAILAAAALLGACTSGPGQPDPTCQQAEEHFQECTGQPLPGDDCNARGAEEILSLDCAALAAAAEGGKLDGWFGRLEGESCLFNLQCEGDLVCVPTSTSHSPQYCAKPTLGSACDSPSDCPDRTWCCREEWFQNGICDWPGPGC